MISIFSGRLTLEIYTTQKYETDRETVEEGTSLEDLLEIPEYHVEAAQDVFMMFINELGQQEEYGSNNKYTDR